MIEMRVIVAGRLSRLVRDRDQTGFDSQERESVRWAKDHGHEVVAVVADFKTGRSGLTARKNLRPWVTDENKLAQFDGIVALKVDRLTRGNREETSDLEDWARDHGKSLLIAGSDVHFPSEGTDGIAWDLMLRMAHQEWLNTSERYLRMQRTLKAKGSFVGRASYGYRLAKVEGIKVPVIYEPEAEVIREAKDRYLAGETIDAICADLMARGIGAPIFKGKPGKTWHAKTLAGILRSTSTAGRTEDKHGKTTFEYKGIISWQDHLALVKRLDSRANRKGISPGNAAMLTSVIHDIEGHPMYRAMFWTTAKYYCRKCKLAADLAEADERVSGIFAHNPRPYLITVKVPGDNHQDEIDQLRITRSELDDLADDYDDRHAELTAKIRELVTLDREHPSEDKLVQVDSGKTMGEVWQAMTIAERRDLMLENGFTVTYLGEGRYQVPEVVLAAE
jgi:DNA invertase Pin-like site-specific DNA recombinase